jgi:hypothetical protein
MGGRNVKRHRLWSRMAPRIAAAGPDRIDELRPLWLQLHHHHQSVSPLQPFVDDETSWARQLYRIR